jgi:hypothetical protein
VKTLRKTLFVHAATWGVVGLLCALFPKTVASLLSSATLATGGTVYRFVPETSDGAILRLLGVATSGLAMFAVLVAQKIESVWWWSWALVLTDVVVAIVAVSHVLFGLPEGSTVFPWWVIGVLSFGLAAWLIWGLFKAAQDQPIIDS